MGHIRPIQSNRVVLRYFFIRLSSACFLLTTVSTAQPPSDVLLTTVSTSQHPSDVLLTTVSTSQPPSDVLLTTVSTSQSPNDVMLTTVSKAQPPSDVKLTTWSKAQPPSDVLLTTVSKAQPPSDDLLTTVSTAQTQSDVLLTTVSKAQPPSDVLLTTVSTAQTPSDVLLTTVSTAETPSDVLLTTVSTAETPSDALMGQVMDDIYKVAPHNRFCNRTEPKIEKSFNPDYGEYSCTIPCSCDPSTCWDKLPCCPDIPEPMPERRRNSSCLYPVISSKPYNVFNHPQNHADFPLRMVHDCEQQHIDSELHRKCLIFRNTSDVEHLVPVVSNSTGIVYANRFCAECSDITHYQTFTTEFICWNFLLEPRYWELLALEWSIENRIKLIEAGMCNYVFNAPNVDELENNRCMQVRYTACNESGEWDVYDPVLEDACGAYELPYEDNFRNFHCMLCNAPSWYSLPENRYRWNPTCYLFKTSILEISFYSLISLDHKQLTGKSSPYLNKVDQACRNMPHTVYDKYTDACRRTFCPLFHFKLDNKCYPVNNASRLNLLPKQAMVAFRELNKTERIKDPYENFTTDVLPVVTRNVLTELIGVELPASWSFFQKEGKFDGDFILELDWLKSKDEEGLVPESIQKFFDNTVVGIPLNGTSGLFEAMLLSNVNSENEMRVNGSPFKRIYRRTNFKFPPTGHVPPPGLQMNKLVLCNRIVLDTSEFNISIEFIFLPSKKQIRVTGANIVTDKGLHLCVEDYLDLTENNSDVESEENGIVQEITVILSFVCSIISILCLVVTILTYVLLKPLRTIPGKINLCLCSSLLIAQILQQFTMDLTQYPTVCTVFGALIHFSWAVTLFWMNTASFNLFRCFSPANMAPDYKPSLLLYTIFVIGMSLFLVCANIGYSLWAIDIGVGYGGRICYITSFYGILITFVSPVGIIILTNMIFLLVTVWRISRTPKPHGTKSVDRNNALIYIKMSTLTGMCWIFGFLRLWTEIEIFELLFVLTNASQGLFLMLSFVCNKRILDNFKELVFNSP